VSDITVTIHSFRFGELNYTTGQTYFLGYSIPMFNGILSVETEHWKTHELMFAFFYDTDSVVISNDIQEFKLSFQATFMKPEAYARLIQKLHEHIKANLEPLDVYTKFVNDSKQAYQLQYQKVKEEFPNTKPSVIHRRMKGSAIYTDQFDMSKVLGTIII